MLRQPPAVAAVTSFFARLSTQARPTAPLGLARPDEALAARLEAFFERYTRRRGFSGAVLVAREGRVVLRRGYGLADDARRRLVTPGTAFDVASIAKQFTAAAIALLASRGRISLEDPLARHLPGVPDDKRGITLHALLTHTAGLDESHVDDDLAFVGRADALEEILLTPLEHRPGTRFSYSNSGFTLLAAVIEEVSGDRYETFMHREILGPAGLRSTGFRGEPRWRTMRVARGYMNGADRGSPADWLPSWSVTGSSGLISTVDDLQTWVTELRSGRLLPPAALEPMFRRWVREAGSAGHYGYGWSLADTLLGPVVEHDGGGPGGNSDLAFYPDESLVIAIASNRITWQGALGVPVTIELPATEARVRLQECLATGDFSRMPSPTFSIVPFGSRAAARLTGLAKAARALVRGARGIDDAPRSSRVASRRGSLGDSRRNR